MNGRQHAKKLPKLASSVRMAWELAMLTQMMFVVGVNILKERDGLERGGIWALHETNK